MEEEGVGYNMSSRYVCVFICLSFCVWRGVCMYPLYVVSNLNGCFYGDRYHMLHKLNRPIRWVFSAYVCSRSTIRRNHNILYIRLLFILTVLGWIIRSNLFHSCMSCLTPRPPLGGRGGGVFFSYSLLSFFLFSPFFPLHFSSFFTFFFHFVAV